MRPPARSQGPTGPETSTMCICVYVVYSGELFEVRSLQSSLDAHGTSILPICVNSALRLVLKVNKMHGFECAGRLEILETA